MGFCVASSPSPACPANFALAPVTGAVQRIVIIFDEGTDTGPDFFRRERDARRARPRERQLAVTVASSRNIRSGVRWSRPPPPSKLPTPMFYKRQLAFGTPAGSGRLRKIETAWASASWPSPPFSRHAVSVL